MRLVPEDASAPPDRARGELRGPGATREVVEEQGGMKEERNIFMAGEHEGDDMERLIRQAKC